MTVGRKFLQKKKKRKSSFRFFFLYSTTFHCETNENFEIFCIQTLLSHTHRHFLWFLYTHRRMFSFLFSQRRERVYSTHKSRERGGGGSTHKFLKEISARGPSACDSHSLDQSKLKLRLEPAGSFV